MQTIQHDTTDDTGISPPLRRLSLAFMELCETSNIATAVDDNESKNKLYIAMKDQQKCDINNYLGVLDGDFIRVGSVDKIDDEKYAMAYVVKRRDTKNLNFPKLEESDKIATEYNIWGRIPMRFLYPIRAKLSKKKMVSLETDLVNYRQLIPYLSITPEIIPNGGWYNYLKHSGILFRCTDKKEKGWSFSALLWDRGTTNAGKTCGACMSLQVINETIQANRPQLIGSRRCQFSIEYDTFGQKMTSKFKGMKQGILVYLPNISTIEVEKIYGVIPPEETALRLSLSALLITYTEIIYIMRRTIFLNQVHPFGGRPYFSQKWDETHTPYKNHFPFVCSSTRKRTIRSLYAYAEQVSKKWLNYERKIYPEYWSGLETTCIQTQELLSFSTTTRTKKSGRSIKNVSLLSLLPSPSSFPVETSNTPSGFKLVEGSLVALYLYYNGHTGWKRTRVLTCNSDGVTFEVNEIFTSEMHLLITLDIQCAIFHENETTSVGPLRSFICP